MSANTSRSTAAPAAVRLASLVRRATAVAGLLGRAAFVFIGLVALAAGLASMFGGRLGFVSVAAEWRVLAPALASGLAHAAALAFVCDRLDGVLGSLAQGDPFVPDNAARLRQIAMAVAALELARYAVQAMSFGIVSLAGQPAGGELAVRFAPSFAAWGSVLVLWVLAHVFAEGARLRRRDQLTV